MKKILLFITLINFSITQAQIEFEKIELFDFNDCITSGTPRTQSIDIDNDGDLDIVVVSKNFDEMNWGTSKLYWFENDGVGNFTNKHLISIQDNYLYLIKMTDFDADGDTDMIIGKDSNIIVFENLGLGNFIQHQILSNVYGNNMVFYDIDSDGDKDMITTFNQKLVWFENIDGLWTFSENYQIIYNYSVRSFCISDLDNDGDFDIVFSTPVKLYWIRNIDGSANFSSEITIKNNVDIRSIVSSDIDNDGDNDLLVKSNIINNENTLSWFENIDENGTFNNENLILTSLSSISNSIYQLDVENDGYPEFIISGNNNDYYLLKNNNANFTSNQIINNLSSDSSFNNFVISDFDGDGLLDFSGYYSDSLFWFKNLSNFEVFDRKVITPYVDNNFITLDFDNDGDIDFFSNTDGPNDASFWYENNGEGGFSINFINGTKDSYSNMLPSDMDSDGDFDLIAYSFSDNNINWYENINGNFDFETQHPISSTALLLRGLTVADIDNDGDQDIITVSSFTSSGNTKIEWYENTNGSFGFKQLIYSYDSSISISSIIDLDNDNDLDIIYNNSGDLGWLENTGLSFNNHILQNAINSVIYSVIVNDVNNDGNLDIICNRYSNISWYSNSNDGDLFGEPITISEEAGFKILCVDIDGDNDLDIIKTSGNYTQGSENSIKWHENINQGEFLDEQTITTEEDNIKLVNIYSIDINGDNKKDIISILSNYTFSQTQPYYPPHIITWHKNLGLLSNKIIGRVAIDINANNCQSTNFIVPNLMVTSENGSESYSTFTQSNGYYELFPQIGNYTTSITSSLPNYYAANPNSYNDNFTDIGNTVTNNFCIEPNQTVNDLNISIIPTNQSRPGFDASYQIVYKNVGTTQLNGNVTFEFDNTKMTFLNASETIALQTSNSLTFNYVNLIPFETRTINLEFNVLVPPIVNIGDELEFTATINPIIDDETEEDNVFNYNQMVVGAFDPNDITVLEGDQIALTDTDKYLHYVIRFQNTGNFFATKVVVENILDDKLDWTTLQLESISHNNRVEIKNGNEVSFTFNGIYLPSGVTDEPNSHGFIAYKIKPKPDIALGDVIPNKADIFFDFNAPIETNTATTTIVNALAVNENRLLDFSVYPTPAENVLNIKSKTEIIKIEIYSKLGQKIKETTENQIDISNLTQGLYFVKMEDINGNFGVKKIVKK